MLPSRSEYQAPGVPSHVKGKDARTRMRPIAPSPVNHRVPLPGNLPEHLFVRVLILLPPPDILALAQCSRRIAHLAASDLVWRPKVVRLDWRGPLLSAPFARSHRRASSSPLVSTPPPIPSRHAYSASLSLQPSADLMVFDDVPLASDNNLLRFEDDPPPLSSSSSSSSSTLASSVHTSSSLSTSAYDDFRSRYSTLLPYYSSFRYHSTDSLLFTTTSADITPLQRAYYLHNISQLFLPDLCPTRSPANVETMFQNFSSALQSFESSFLSEFEWADRCEDTAAMRIAAQVLWALNDGKNALPLYLEKREFYCSQSHNPKKNLVSANDPSHSTGLDFTALTNFMADILSVVSRECSIITKVFPFPASVIINYTKKMCDETVAEYISSLLALSRNLPPPLFLLATAASFTHSMKISEVISKHDSAESRLSEPDAQGVIYDMFEQFIPEYLVEEENFVREALKSVFSAAQAHGSITGRDTHDPSFLASNNPALVKRNVLAGFTKALLLPVTVVPKAAAFSFNAVASVGAGAFNAVVNVGAGLGVGRTSTPPVAPGYSSHLAANAQKHSSTIDLIDTIDDDDTDPVALSYGRLNLNNNNNNNAPPSLVTATLEAKSSSAKSSSSILSNTSTTVERLPNLLSLDTTLQLVQCDRDSLKRMQTFAKYPGPSSARIKKSMGNIFIALIQILGDDQVVPAFELASTQMSTWNPGEHMDEEQSNMAPLVQFFELVHVGDTIQQMLQVFFEREMAIFIDSRDFLNPVVREKKRFEGNLDSAVAQGLNEGISALMSQVDHILATNQDPLDFVPPDVESLDLHATKACNTAIACLETHCKMLKGSTNRQVLEVFYTELGIRLHALIIKHLKRSIISRPGGFQVIADVNAYTAFISTLHQADLTTYFSALKMVANVYILENPKDLVAFMRDVSRFEGTLRTEDAYELLQRRTDWKQIEKQVDRHLYGLSTEDCIIQ